MKMESHQTEKIPDFILLKESRKEIGKLKAYIEELELNIVSLKKLTPAEKALIKKNEKTEELKSLLKKREKRIKELEIMLNRVLSNSPKLN